LAFWWFICEAEARIMANITKIILGLNILAGGAGIFFGITKSGQASELVEKAKTAETNAKAAQGKVTGLEDDKKDLTAKFSTANSSAQSLQTQLDQIKGSASGKDTRILKLQADKASLDTQLENIGLAMTQLRAKANLGKQAKDDLDRVQKEKADLEAELQKLRAPKKPKGSKKPTVGTGGMVGTIANVDPRTGSLILNRGSSHGFKVGDEYDVFRNNTLIGRIKVTRLSPTNTGLSSAQRSEGLGVPAGAQFQVNDDLFKIPVK
jgi:hypothetical protein